MELATAIFAALGAVLTLIVYLIRKKDAVLVDPAEQNRKRYEQIARDVLSEKSTDNTLHTIADLDELDRLRRERAKTDRSSIWSGSNASKSE